MHDMELKLITAGDISRDGKEILLKVYDAVYYWKVNGQESISKTLKRTPLLLPYTPEPQGEGICWSSDNNGYYTISEIRYKVMPRLNYYPRIGEKR